MRWSRMLAMVVVLALFGLEVRAGLDGDEVIVSGRYPTQDDVTESQAVVVGRWQGDTARIPWSGLNRATIKVEPDRIIINLRCGYSRCHWNYGRDVFRGFAISDLDWSDPPGPPIGVRVRSSIFFDPDRVQLGTNEILIETTFMSYWAGDVIEIDLQFAPQVSIDIVPRNSRNAIGRSRWVPVAILGSWQVDVSQIDPFSLRFGPGEALGARSSHSHLSYRLVVKDINQDGHYDLVTRFRTADAAIPTDAIEACLSGELDGRPFVACDAINTKRRKH